jgi:hypothetical protein
LFFNCGDIEKKNNKITFRALRNFALGLFSDKSVDKSITSLFASSTYVREIGHQLCSGGVLAALEFCVSELSTNQDLVETMTTSAKELYNELETCSAEIEAGLYDDPKYSAVKRLLTDFHKENGGGKSLILLDCSVGVSALMGQLLRLHDVVPILYQATAVDSRAQKSV